MSEATPTTHRRQRRGIGALWIASAVAAVALILSVNGTLATWTQAIITNTQNDVKSAASVALSESSGGTECVNTASNATNIAECTTINKYGGTDKALVPGGSQTATVVMKNTGTGTGTLTLAPGACSSTAVAGSGANPTASPVCDKVTVAITCAAPGTLNYGPATLTAFSTEQTVGTLASGESTSCTFTVTLPSDTPSAYADQIAAQELVWTLKSA